jgi:hypothetical protein
MTPNEVATVPTEDAILQRLQHHLPNPFAHRIARFYGNLRSRGNANRDREVKGRHRMLRRLRATASPNDVVLTRPTKWPSSGATSTRIPRIQRRARRPITTFELSPRSCRLTMRLSDAGLRRGQTKLIYPNHRLPPRPTEDVSPRSLEPIVRFTRAIPLERSRPYWD